MCGKKFQYHYIENLREHKTTGALLFGSALDKTFNELLLDVKNNSKKEVKYYSDLFEKNWTTGEINKVVYNIRDCEFIEYAESDIDYDLLSHEAALEQRELHDRKKFLNLEQFKLLNTHYWDSLLGKGQIIIESLYNVFIPKIKEVLEVQGKIQITNSDQDEIEGYVDCVLDLGNGPIICDLKTSTRKYAYDSANISPQLALYAHALKQKYSTNKTAYIVVYKNLLKNRVKICEKCYFDGSGSRAKTCTNEQSGSRCLGNWVEQVESSAKIEVIEGVISESFENNVLENFQDVLHGVKNQVFPRNWSSCTAFNKPCPYIDKCYKGK